MDVFMSLLLFFIFVTFVFFLVVIFFPEYVGITGKKANEVMEAQRADPPTAQTTAQKEETPRD